MAPHTMNFSDFLIMDGEGDEIRADAFGQNVAFACWHCGHPLLAIALENQRGFDQQHPTVCKGCNRAYFLDVRPHMQKLYIHALP